MIEEQVQVVEICDEGVWVESHGQSACGTCHANSVCGTSALQKWFNRHPNRLRVAPGVDPVSIGDHVVIGIPERAVMQGALLVYLLPLIGLLVGGLAGALLAQQLAPAYENAFSILLGVGLMIAVYRRVSRQMSSRRYSHDFQPVILRKTGPGLL